MSHLSMLTQIRYVQVKEPIWVIPKIFYIRLNSWLFKILIEKSVESRLNNQQLQISSTAIFLKLKVILILGLHYLSKF